MYGIDRPQESPAAGLGLGVASLCVTRQMFEQWMTKLRSKERGMMGEDVWFFLRFFRETIVVFYFDVRERLDSNKYV